jgi:hypothetical protein
VTDFLAGRRFISLLQSGTAPESVLRDAASAQLSLPMGDRLLILVYLADNPNKFQSQAQQTISQLDQKLVSELLNAPACPEEIKSYVERHASDLTPEEQKLLELALQEDDEPFELIDATQEEQQELAAQLAMAATADGQPVDEKTLTLLQRLAKMSVPERVKLALRGGRDERLLLVRDGNKVVQRAVITSPRMTENDADMISNMRNVGEEVLRNLAADHRYRKSLSVIRNLVNNPKTPVEVSVPLLKHLFATDLKLLSTNKNVADVMRRMAAKVLEAKAKGR